VLKGKDATPFAPCLKPFLFGWVDFDFLGGEEEGKGNANKAKTLQLK
jgi:hypothetical protein